MATQQNSLEGSTPLKIRRGRVESVDLYEIKDHELDTLEKGTPADLQLNFAIFALSVAITAIATLFSATFNVRAVETGFTVAAVAGLLFGAYLLFSWWTTRSTVKDLCTRIRERIPAETVVVVTASKNAEEEEEEEEDQ